MGKVTEVDVDEHLMAIERETSEEDRAEMDRLFRDKRRFIVKRCAPAADTAHRRVVCDRCNKPVERIEYDRVNVRNSRENLRISLDNSTSLFFRTKVVPK